MSDAAGRLLEVRNLHVHFDTYEGIAEVINGVDLTVEAGQTTAIVGESGCGKSVTVKTILGLLPEGNVVEGTISYKGEELTTKSEEARHTFRGTEMSMIMQNPLTALNPVYTVGQQMMDVVRWQGAGSVKLREIVRNSLSFRRKGELKQRCIEMLDEVQISAPERVFSSYPVELSGGMRQRVLIAIALLSEPDLLIADEPGTALDVTTEAKILSLLDDLVEERGASVLYITHDLGVAREISDAINVMYAGEIVEHAPTEALFEDPQHPYTRKLLESIPQLSRGIGEGIEGRLPDYTDPPSGCRFAPRCAYAERDCEEVFPYPRKTDTDHAVACHLHTGPPAFDRHESIATRHTVNIGKPPWKDETAHEHATDLP